MKRSWQIAVACLGVCVIDTSARAEYDEWAVSFGPSYRGLSEAWDDTTVFRSAPGAMVRVRYGVDDFFQIGASLEANLALATDASTLGPIGAAFFEVHYVVDIVTWVPFVSAGIGGLVRTSVPNDDTRFDLALMVGGGLEYRPERDWALGFTGHYDFVVTDFERADAFSLALVYTLFFE
jgi:opacity protein-like surface antigen